MRNFRRMIMMSERPAEADDLGRAWALGRRPCDTKSHGFEWTHRLEVRLMMPKV